MLTVNELFRLGYKMLSESGIEDAVFDARCLIEHCLDISSSGFFIKQNEFVSQEKETDYLSLISRRCSREPLQYIIGKWEFYSNCFYVGKGVLIPRPETEMLIDEAKIILNEMSDATVVDFCSGTGCIAITIAKLFPNTKVFAVEKYDEAYSYIVRNIELNNVKNVEVIKGDIFDKNVLNNIHPNLIISNPPYIKSEDIFSLQPEVRTEPHTALDGGEDGYDFYKFLSDFWFNEYLQKGSLMLLECAEDQGDSIASMLSGLAKKTEVLYDFNGLQRVVKALK